MKLIGLVDEDFTNYKKACMYIGFPNCSFKCGCELCQNYALNSQERIEISYESLVKRYMENNLTDAIVIAGLEPFDDYEDLLYLIREFRRSGCNDDIVIYTGYTKDEIDPRRDEIRVIGKRNIIIKFGRYIPNNEPHFDELLGVYLASDNQHAERIC